MNVLISGGCKNGKSLYAQAEAKRQAGQIQKPAYYVATMIPKDEEDRARIKRHVAERDSWGFMTLEQGTDICAILETADRGGVFLLDSITALLSNEMFPVGGRVDLEAPERIQKELLEFAGRTGHTIFVSDFIYADAGAYDWLTEAYRRGLAQIDRALAARCGQVTEVAYGARICYRQGQPVKPGQENL